MTCSHKPSVLILGTRGLPAGHGGFETFTERLALYLTGRGWEVTVYCQPIGSGEPTVDYWRGIRRINFPTVSHAPLATMAFDWRSVSHALTQRGVPLVLGYNTAVFAARLRLAGRHLLINMDGLEWKRAKWPWFAKIWLYLNEWVGSVAATKLIADHPEIAKRYAGRRKAGEIRTICYGADEIRNCSDAPVRALGLEPGKYFLAVGRIEPENMVLEILSAYAGLDTEIEFAYVGKLDRSDRYHNAVAERANGRVFFPGAIYDKETINALRCHCLAYCHGHSVGGTNPSLVEALGAGSAVIAHDNPFNRWVAGPQAAYCSNEEEFTAVFRRALGDGEWIARLRQASREQFQAHFGWPALLGAYEQLLLEQLEETSTVPADAMHA